MNSIPTFEVPPIDSTTNELLPTPSAISSSASSRRQPAPQPLQASSTSSSEQSTTTTSNPAPLIPNFPYGTPQITNPSSHLRVPQKDPFVGGGTFTGMTPTPNTTSFNAEVHAAMNMGRSLSRNGVPVSAERSGSHEMDMEVDEEGNNQPSRRGSAVDSGWQEGNTASSVDQHTSAMGRLMELSNQAIGMENASQQQPTLPSMIVGGGENLDQQGQRASVSGPVATNRLSSSYSNSFRYDHQPRPSQFRNSLPGPGAPGVVSTTGNGNLPSITYTLPRNNRPLQHGFETRPEGVNNGMMGGNNMGIPSTLQQPPPQAHYSYPQGSIYEPQPPPIAPSYGVPIYLTQGGQQIQYTAGTRAFHPSYAPVYTMVPSPTQPSFYQQQPAPQQMQFLSANGQQEWTTHHSSPLHAAFPPQIFQPAHVVQPSYTQNAFAYQYPSEVEQPPIPSPGFRQSRQPSLQSQQSIESIHSNNRTRGDDSLDSIPRDTTREEDELDPHVAYVINDDGEEIRIRYTSDADIKQTPSLKRECFSCGSRDPPSWRKNPLNPKKILCNRCGIATKAKGALPDLDALEGNRKVSHKAKAKQVTPAGLHHIANLAAEAQAAAKKNVKPLEHDRRTSIASQMSQESSYSLNNQSRSSNSPATSYFSNSSPRNGGGAKRSRASTQASGDEPAAYPGRAQPYSFARHQSRRVSAVSFPTPEQVYPNHSRSRPPVRLSQQTSRSDESMEHNEGNENRRKSDGGVDCSPLIKGELDAVLA